MSHFHNTALIGAAGQSGAASAYQIDRSLRFTEGDSSYLNFTPQTEGNRKTFTFSCWVKKGRINLEQFVFGAATDANNRFQIFFLDISNADKLQVLMRNGGSVVGTLVTTRLFRDPSAWFHLVVSIDTTQATASDRAKIYINGSQVTDFDSSTYPSQNTELEVGNTSPHTIGTRGVYSQVDFYDGYLADVHFIDGQALAPTDFGEYDSNNVWQPKEFVATGPNNGTTWSSGAGSNFESARPASNGFNGDPESFTRTDNASVTATVTLPSSVPFSTLQVRGARDSGNGTITINGVDVSSQFTSSSSTLETVTITGVTSPLTSIALTGIGGSAQPRFSEIIVDGVALVDGDTTNIGVNGFNLDFSDNSSDQALGYDAAVTQPTLNPRGGMDVITYTGNGSTQTIGGLAFQPDLLWIKSRSNAYYHILVDSVRGNTKELYSNDTTAEQTTTNTVTSFDSNGFSLGSRANTNQSSATYVAWAWKAGGPAVLNEDGSIDSQVSVSTDYGFSVVSWTGTNAAATIGHSLGSAPKFIIVKNRDDSVDWRVYHGSLADDEGLRLNTTGAKVTSRNDWWNNTSPTDTVFSVANDGGVNGSGDDMVAYCWSEVSGFSKFGSYSGNGQTLGPTVTTGFKPRLVAIKRTDSAGNWEVYDSARSLDKDLKWNTSEAEGTAPIIFNSDGFQTNYATGSLNASGGTYVYAAFADRPGNNWTTNNLIAEAGLETASQGMDVVLYTGNESTQKVGGPVYSATSDPSMTSAGQIFNGSLSTGGYYPGTGTDVVLTTSPFTINTQLRVYNNFRSDGTYAICLNGSCVNVPGSGTNSANFRWSTVDLSSFTLPLDVTKLGYSLSQNSGNTIMAIEVDSTILIDGTGSPLNFQPDFVWIKPRNQVNEHVLVDVVRGAGYRLFSNQTNAENYQATSLTSFDSSGFSLGSHTSVNKSSIDYVAWCWKAGGTASSNTDGSITSSVSANQTYGFSIVSYTGNNTTSTVGHGLNAVPKWVIVKSRSAASPTGWMVKHSSLQSNYNLALNLTDAAWNPATNGWVGDLTSSTTFSLVNGSSNGNNVNQSGVTYIAYCWSEVPGFSKFGSYTGNGSTTGPVVTLGFKPRFILVRSTSSSRGWVIWDTARDTNTTNDNNLFPNNNSAESSSSDHNLIIRDDGFQLATTSVNRNGSGETYIYAAFASKPPGEIIDSLIDTPTNYESENGNAGGNYCTWNPLKPTSGTLSQGNLRFAGNSQWRNTDGTIAVSSGKWYFEATYTGGQYGSNQGNLATGIGFKKIDANLPEGSNQEPVNSSTYRSNTLAFYQNGYFTDFSTHSSVTTQIAPGDVVGVSINYDAGTYAFYVNGSSVTSGSLSYTGELIPWAQAYYSTDYYDCNFGQRPFAYTPPSGHLAVVTTNLTDPTIADGSVYFQTALWSGTSSARSITTTGMSPDWVWIKERGVAGGHNLYDAVRGATKFLASEDTNAEGTDSAALTSFNSDGFSLGTGFTVKSANKSGRTYAGWCWDAGSSTATNTDGSITSQVRANASAGFSIVSYTGDGSGTDTIGHGLNAAPSWVITKSRGTTGSWRVFADVGGTLKLGNLNNTDAFVNATVSAPTSSVFSVDGNSNTSTTHIAYCFAPVAGYSSFGSYTGNGSADGPFVFTGMRPAFLLIKETSGSGDWQIVDSARSPFNQVDDQLYANISDAEYNTSNRAIDFTSNGFKIRGNNAGLNPSGETFIYAAFAEHPFKTARAR